MYSKWHVIVSSRLLDFGPLAKSYAVSLIPQIYQPYRKAVAAKSPVESTRTVSAVMLSHRVSHTDNLKHKICKQKLFTKRIRRWENVKFQKSKT